MSSNVLIQPRSSVTTHTSQSMSQAGDRYVTHLKWLLFSATDWAVAIPQGSATSIKMERSQMILLAPGLWGELREEVSSDIQQNRRQWNGGALLQPTRETVRTHSSKNSWPVSAWKNSVTHTFLFRPWILRPRRMYRNYRWLHNVKFTPIYRKNGRSKLWEV